MNAPEVWLIAAYAVPSRVIGANGTLPWRRANDLAHFKMVTMGHPLIMGRTTWTSLGRPLPGRMNIVLSRDPAFQVTSTNPTAPVAVSQDLDAAIAVARAHCDAAPIIIGGAQIYTQALQRDLPTRLFLTEIALTVSGDTFMPGFGDGWQESSRRRDGDCTFLELERRQPQLR